MILFSFTRTPRILRPRYRLHYKNLSAQSRKFVFRAFKFTIEGKVKEPSAALAKYPKNKFIRSKIGNDKPPETY